MSDDSETVEDTGKGSLAEVTDESIGEDPHYFVKQEPTDHYQTAGSCFTIQVSSLLCSYSTGFSNYSLCLYFSYRIV